MPIVLAIYSTVCSLICALLLGYGLAKAVRQQPKDYPRLTFRASYASPVIVVLIPDGLPR
jgi:hypothetical protein